MLLGCRLLGYKIVRDVSCYVSEVVILEPGGLTACMGPRYHPNTLLNRTIK
jgi:hypothetical protein